MLLRSLPVALVLFHLVSGWNYGGGGGGGGDYGHGWEEKIPSKIIVKHIPKHVPVYKPIPIPKPIPVPKPVGFLKPLAIAKPFSVPHVVPVIKHFQKPFPVLKGVPIHFPIPLPKLVKLPFQIKLPKPYIVRVPKPYAVAKKFPVAVPVHIPKPYVVPVYKPVPVGVPQKIPKIVNVYKEVPEYVKKPVPVYIEEKPYKPDNYKGTPYIPSDEGSYKGSPYPTGGHKGTPFPSGGNKGTPYKGGNGGGEGYHGKGSNVHATSAANFLAAHAGKLTPQSHGYGDILAAYSQNHAFSGLHNLGGGIHGGYQAIQGFGNFHGFGGNNLNLHGSYGEGAQELGNLGGYDQFTAYGRGANVDKAKDGGADESQPTGYSHNEENQEGTGEVSYDNYGSQNGGSTNNQEENGGYNNNQAFLGVSVTTFNDHSGRGGGYNEEQNGGYNGQGGYETHESGEKDAISNNEGYKSGAGQENHNSGSYEAQRGNFAQIPAITLYHLQNGAATAINYPNAASTYYNTGSTEHNTQQGYNNQGEEGQGYGQNQDFGVQSYGQNERPEISNQKPLQQSSYGYQGQTHYTAASQKNNQEYPAPQNQEAAAGYGNEEQYQNENNYNQQNAGYQYQANSEVYNNQASYQINHGFNGGEAGYGTPNVAQGLQNYGLRAAYAVQPGADGHSQLQGASGTSYVRAYDNQGENQAAYTVHNPDSYQAQEAQQTNTYSPYSNQKSADAVPEKETKDQTLPAASGRSYDGSSSSQLVGGSNGFSTPEGGDTKGGSWRAVQ